MATTLTAPARTSRRTAVEPSRKRRKPLSPARIIATVIVAVLAVTWLVPFAWATVTAFKSETEAAAAPITLVPKSGFTFDAFAKVLQQGNIPQWTWNSLFTSAAVTAVTLVISALAAYALSRIDFKGRKVLMTVIVASLIVPPPVLIIPLFYQMVSFHMIDTYWGIILPQVIAPAMVFVLKKFFDQIPRELEDAALVDGAGRIRIFLQVVLPLSRPILAAVAIFVFIGAWNNFLWPFIVTNDSAMLTLPVGLQTIKSAYGIQYAQNMASALLAALPLILVFLFFQRQIIKGISTTGLAGT
ncbi:multiple sugar transport system permease protein [Arthrobacter silviterrae]|uniref:Carbohydrate ABC transporter permease n=1 Tax=Arthrobacter silviterrae TaxID=2026658 RepID=A0ABX0DE19_9MICC|nr:carbohydrate ABC transporter permease [Arthrobacter silviterrae]MDQ0278218.1 multiple sugar transport system permease protein [Arthrobacter silviterrae]NGN84878.1 carbohydrate ABC transporter permease [Arthrobacter silviterrae]